MKTMTVLGWVAKAMAVGALQIACAVQADAGASATGGAGGEATAGLGGAGGEPSRCEEGDYACELNCAQGDAFCQGRAQQGCAYEEREWTCVGGGADGGCVWQSECPTSP